MSTTIQPLENIAPAPGAEKKKSSDPAQADFDDGKEFLANKELAQAAISFHNALLAFEEREDDAGIANASNQLGNICLEKQEFEKALPHFKKAWEICEKLDDPMSMLMLRQHLVKVYIGMQDFAAAINICLDLLDAYHSDNNPQGGVEIMEIMADIYVQQGDSPRAIDAYRTIASIHAGYGHGGFAEKFEKMAKDLEEA